MPTAPQRCDVEIAQSRNLDIELFSVQQRRADLYARHGGLGGAALRLTRVRRHTATDLVGSMVVDSLGDELQIKTLAHYTGEETSHRVLLPTGRLRNCRNR